MKAPLERLSSLATISRHERAFAVTADVIHTKAAEAKSNPRKREILVLQRGDRDPLQRMLNAIQPGSYVRPHRHSSPPKAESLVLLTGAIGFVPFFEDGTPDRENFILLDKTRGVLAADFREGLWHTFFALEPDTVVFEVKPGPYDPATDKEFAPWAPAEDAPDAASYLSSLEQIFRNECDAPLRIPGLRG
jgi:cupin fold WbuC family metalloprotein